MAPSLKENSAPVIPTLISENSKILFVGINPTITPIHAYNGHYFSGRGNLFWKCLSQSGMLPPNIYTPADDVWLHKYYQVSFTNYVSRPTRRAQDITSEEYAKGAERLSTLLAKYTPSLVCFVGLDIYKNFVKKPASKIKVGIKRNLKLNGNKSCKVFVLPSTSNLGVRYSHEDKKGYFRDLAAYMEKSCITLSL